MMMRNFTRLTVRPLGLLALAVLLVGLPARPATAQDADKAKDAGKKLIRGHDRDRGHEMLNNIKEALKKHYYDPTYRGLDLDARFKAAHERVKNAQSNSEIFSVIAQLMADFNDSHTYLRPPARVGRADYGWTMQIIGDKCYVVEVTPGSDAAAKGLKVGDEIWSIDGFEPTRENLWKIKYSYFLLKPRPGMRLVVQYPDGEQREIVALSKIVSLWDNQKEEAEDDDDEDKDEEKDKNKDALKEQEQEKERKRKEKEKEREKWFLSKYKEVSSDLFIWRIPRFRMSEKEIDEMAKKIHPYRSVIIDLRNNGGGYESNLLRLLGYFYEQDMPLGEIKRRKETKPLIAKTRGAERVFKGRLAVLIDSESASASELFARVIQLTKRGIVIGDRSEGKVMRGRPFSYTYARGVPDEMILSGYGVTITDADLIMTDGKSLEGVGVVPDEVVLPSGDDLAARRDPALARAAQALGFSIEPDKAGALFKD